MDENSSTTTGAQDKTQKFKDAASDMMDRASETARDAGNKARRAATDASGKLSEQVKELLNRQVGDGAAMAGDFAGSMHVAADDLERSSPALAGLVRGFGNKVEDYANDFQDKTVDELMSTASDFTRKQPALVFGLAALAGFFIFRTVKSAPRSNPSPSIQPSGDEYAGGGNG